MSQHYLILLMRFSNMKCVVIYFYNFVAPIYKLWKVEKVVKREQIYSKVDQTMVNDFEVNFKNMLEKNIT